ncbi:hypothetical protein PROFUN_15170 [Planoprotostelium fungivorum]|uniref:Zn(2)-C6 fungal-type domain-containing protein n=1 Tax=Planoprotostelium fungivorum TaxID=1890364 RepID=A0A2P6MU16_9EUKA|nr:hypothetical protein PROFUN_15170 [Planoprotostelium fungivorum]
MSRPITSRRPAKACIACYDSHISCDKEKPCRRCVSKGLDCIERQREKRKSKKAPTPHTYPDPNFLDLIDCVDDFNVHDILPFPPLPEGTSSLPVLPSELILKNWIPPSPSSNAPDFASTFDPTAVPPSFDLYDVDFASKWYSRSNQPRGGAQVVNAITWYQEKTSKLLCMLTTEQKRDMFLHYEQVKRDAQIAADMSEFPVVVFGGKGIILHVNRAMRRMTKWEAPTPTKVQDYALFQILSPECVVGCQKHMPAVILNGLNRHTMKGGFKIYGTNDYVNGSLCYTTKRDVFDLPLLFIIHFVPEKDEEEAFHGVVEEIPVP